MTLDRVILGALSAACLSGCTSTTYVDHGVVFEPYELVTGAARYQTILAGFFLGGAMADFAVVSVGEDDDRDLRIYAFDGSAWTPAIEAPLGRGVSFVDVVEVGGRDRLLLFESDRLLWFDPESGSERPLLALTASYDATGDEGIPHVDVTRDLNGDGREDLVLPAVDGFWISTQSTEGSFSDAVRLGPPEPLLDEVPLGGARRWGELGVNAETAPGYLSRVHQLDYDRDGRSDLAFWNEDHFDVHLQDERGGFDPVPVTFASDVPFDSDGVYSQAFGYDDESGFRLLTGLRKKTRRTVLHSLRDLNADGVADLITHTLEGRSLLKLRTTLAVHLGEVTPQGIRFARRASASIRTRGRQPAGYAIQQLGDLDGDGQLECMLLEVDAGICDMFQALVANSIDLDLAFYRSEDGAFLDEPTTTRRVRPDSRILGCRGPFFPTVLLGDVNGDGLADLLAAQSWEKLHVFVGVPGPELLAENPQGVELALTADERDARILDLNRDGKQDVLVHHRARPAQSRPGRLAVLISR